MDQGTDGQTGAGDPAAPAGWYPVDGGMQRYWDGRAWTEHMAPAASPDPVASPDPSAPNFGATSQIAGPGPDPNRVVGPDPTTPSADAPTPWVGGAPAGQVPQQPQPFAAPAESRPFSVPTPGPGAYPGPAGQPIPPAMISSDDKSSALLLHLLSLVIGFLGPLVIWLSKRDQSPFIDHHGKTALNFQISLFVYWIGTFFAIFLIVGILLVPILLVIQILFPIMAAVAANRGEYYRYPLAIPFIR